MAATSSASSPAVAPVATQTLPLFPEEPVEYMRVELEDGHLFIFDKEAATRSSGTLRVMIEARNALDTVPEAETNKIFEMKIADHGTLAFQGILTFLYWRKRYINCVIEKIQDWPIPRENQALLQEMAVCAHFLEI